MSRQADGAMIQRHRLIAGDVFIMGDTLADILMDRSERGRDGYTHDLHVEAIRALQNSILYHFEVLELEGLTEDDAIKQLKITRDAHIMLNDIMRNVGLNALDL